MKRFFRWMFRTELIYAYHDGWVAGVNQQKYEPETAEHGLQTAEEYWGGE